MQPTLADQLIATTDADLDSAEEWLRAQCFIYDALYSIQDQLPPCVQECLKARGIELPPEQDLVKLRVRLWESIEFDSMGITPDGAAVRAALFAFFLPTPEGPDEAIWYFCMFYVRAGLPEEPLIAAFRRQWPQVGA
ncbi:MAG TPA: hypothetical protein VGS07_22035 [Thermoanaerobaculia bacterium]|jgi:hypothetical protein|nr:hypothetical protein [Thermoanaerobaculia bacterium]